MKVKQLIEHLTNFPMDANVNLYVDVERYDDFIFDYFDTENILDLTVMSKRSFTEEEKAFITACESESIGKKGEVEEYLYRKKIDSSYDGENYGSITDAWMMWREGIDYAKKMGSSN